MNNNNLLNLSNKIKDISNLSLSATQWKVGGKKIVFTNGCFDLLHVGHLTYLAKAAELGNKLVIGLNCDESVKRLKGESRPVNNQESRAMLLAALFFVDAVTIFYEDTPFELIKTLMPDILVKGGDYTKENIVGAKEVISGGGEVNIISFLDGYSSTSIIHKIKTTNLSY